ncbi:MAG: DUF4230 domain-containing protein [Liquorilactobacillus ghanensis]|uniref:DUF4230 domain-containing protein n=1 Tax=Liquorilactobacillus ghanensis TaxID=399370 RepID=UPI0039ECCEB1
MKKIQQIIFWILLAIVIFGGGYLFYQHQHAAVEEQTSTANYSVKDIGQLDVENVFYDKTVNQAESGSFLGIKVGKETSLYIFHFKAQVYYDLDKAHSSYNAADKTLTVQMPQPEIKLLLKDSKYHMNYDYYKVHNSIFVKDSDDKGLKVEQQAADEVKKDILAKPDVIASAKSSARKTLTQMFARDNVKVKCVFS